MAREHKSFTEQGIVNECILYRKASVRQRAEVYEFSTAAFKGCSPRSLPLVVRTAL